MWGVTSSPWCQNSFYLLILCYEAISGQSDVHISSAFWVCASCICVAGSSFRGSTVPVVTFCRLLSHSVHTSRVYCWIIFALLVVSGIFKITWRNIVIETVLVLFLLSVFKIYFCNGSKKNWEPKHGILGECTMRFLLRPPENWNSSKLYTQIQFLPHREHSSVLDLSLSRHVLTVTSPPWGKYTSPKKTGSGLFFMPARPSPQNVVSFSSLSADPSLSVSLLKSD